LAVYHLNLAVFLMNAGRVGEAGPHALRALALRGQLAADAPGHARYHPDLAIALHNVGAHLSDARPPAGARHHPPRAPARPPPARGALPPAACPRGAARGAGGGWAEAEPRLRRSLELRRKLAADFPRKPGYRAELAASHHNLAVLLENTGRPAEGEEQFREAV